MAQFKFKEETIMKKTYSKTRRNFAIGFAAIMGVSMITLPLVCHAESPSNLYPETGIITAIDFEDDYSDCLLEITVANGNIFSCYSENCDWWYNDIVSMIMDDNGTEYVDNDEIVMIQYSGRLEHFEQWVVPEEE
jgi:hypothetical protein